MTMNVFRAFAIAVAVNCALVDWSAAQSKPRLPDGTPLVCNFTWTLAPGNGPGDARDCGGYHFRLIRELGIQFYTLSISEPGSDKELTYLVSQIPITRPETGMEAPMVLVDRNGQLTRIVVMRRVDRLNIAVGEVPFSGPPPGRVRPN